MSDCRETFDDSPLFKILPNQRPPFLSLPVLKVVSEEDKKDVFILIL